MLAQTYISADALGVTEIERAALINLLHQMEDNQLKVTEKYDEIGLDSIFMPTWFTRGECGTIGCLAGTAHLQTKGAAFPELRPALAEYLSNDHSNVRPQVIWDVQEALRQRIHPHMFALFRLVFAEHDVLTGYLRKLLTTGSIK